jgi:hypothetical protein|tara:strand:- start:490 stop:1194 length:705 start_codon:yes stop_codon:yes gene_type:complete
LQKLIDMENEELDKITEMLCTKSVLKQDVFKNTVDQFQVLKKVAISLVDRIKEKVCSKDDRIIIDYHEKSKYEFHIILAGDILVFNLHSNVFKFDENHTIWKTPYLEEDESRGYTGIINVYNFLSDSFRFNRVNDFGYLIGRLFVNNENHFYAEGKRTLSFLYTDFANLNFDPPLMEDIIENLMIHILEFDLYAPLYELVSEVSVHEVKTTGDSIQLKTGKRMGFQFSTDVNIK